MKKNIFFHDKKNFFHEIICARQFLYLAYWLIITAEKAVFVCLTSPDSRPINVCVACLT